MEVNPAPRACSRILRDHFHAAATSNWPGVAGWGVGSLQWDQDQNRAALKAARGLLP